MASTDDEDIEEVQEEEEAIEEEDVSLFILNLTF